MALNFGLTDPTPAPDLQGMETEERIEAMVDWFMENFEDPVNETPHDSGEGGYQYIWGGPFDAREELQQHFSEAEDEDIETAVSRIEREGIVDWAPAGIRIQNEPPDDGEDGREEPLKDRLAALRQQLDEVEEGIRRLPERPSMLGHNNPPEGIQDYPHRRDREDALQSIEEVRRELDKPDPAADGDAETVKRAESKLREFAGRLWGWVKAIGKLVGGAALAEAGKELVDDPIGLATKIETVASTLAAWVHHLQLPF